ncbi:hypothetical protein Tco_0885531 [Tanacetum coccineum]
MRVEECQTPRSKFAESNAKGYIVYDKSVVIISKISASNFKYRTPSNQNRTNPSTAINANHHKTIGLKDALRRKAKCQQKVKPLPKETKRSLRIAITTVNALNVSGYHHEQSSREARRSGKISYPIANRYNFSPIWHKPEDVVVRVDGFTFLADFVVVNFEPTNLREVPIIFRKTLTFEPQKLSLICTEEN